MANDLEVVPLPHKEQLLIKINHVFKLKSVILSNKN